MLFNMYDQEVCALFRGKRVLMLLVLIMSFLSYNVAILHILKLTFSSVFAEFKTEKAKQGSHPQHTYHFSLP